MINLKAKDTVSDAVKSILQQEEGKCVTTDKAKKIAKKEVDKHETDMHKEEIDVNVRSKDDIKGRAKTNQKDDVGPAADGKSTKVKFRGGPQQNESVEKELAPTKPPAGIVKTEKAIPSGDEKAKEERKKQGMKESLNLKMFKEKYEQHSIYDQLINEVLSKDASAGDWIHDFVHSDNPKFKGKSKEMRKKMALAAYYAKQRNEEVEQVEEGWDEMMKAAKERSKPQPSGGSGVKHGSRYGGSKQKEKPEQEVKESKRPESDNVPFVTNENTPLANAKDLAKKSMKKLKNEMMGKISN